jgi:hypothetical protein
VDDLTVDVTSLAGFKLDLQDLEINSSSNASRLLSAVSLPTGSTGIIATLTTSFGKFQSDVSTAQQADLTAVGTLGTNLSIAATKYQATDDTNANAISAASTNDFGNSSASGSTGATQGVTRFGGLQLPSLLEFQENQYTVRQVVTSAISQISVYDEPLSARLACGHS